MGEPNKPFAPASPEEAEPFLSAVPIPEDWGGDGQGRMNLSRRRTAISPEYVPHQYQFFDSNAIPEEEWRVRGMLKQGVPAKRRLLSWHDDGASTSKVVMSPQFEIPAGLFTADLEVFVLSGVIQLGEWQLHKHSYSFIPAGVRVGPWKVLEGEAAEILWMENGPGLLQYRDAQQDHEDARLSDFIPTLDSRLLPWAKADTAQFVTANKKWLRKKRRTEEEYGCSPSCHTMTVDIR